MCQLCVHRDMKYLGSLESTQEARVALRLEQLLKPGFHQDISISIRTDAGAENQTLSKMADDTVDGLALMFMLMSPPILISQKCDISISIRRTEAFVFLMLMLMLMLMSQVFLLALVALMLLLLLLLMLMLMLISD